MTNEPPIVVLDDLDRRLVTLLQQDARMSVRAMSRELEVAAGTVAARVAKLESSGVIRGYSAQIDENRIGRPLGFVVGLQMNQGSALAETVDELADHPDIDEVLVVTGQWDLLVLGRVADTTALNALITTGLWQSPLFRHSETMLVIDRR